MERPAIAGWARGLVDPATGAIGDPGTVGIDAALVALLPLLRDAYAADVRLVADEIAADDATAPEADDAVAALIAEAPSRALLRRPGPDGREHAAWRLPDGRGVLIVIRAVPVGEDDDLLTTLTLIDAAVGEAGAVRALAEARARAPRTRALEMNDTVVQGLTASLMSLQGGDLAECEVYLQRTLHSLRQMMNDWLEPLVGQDLRPGDLVRTTEAVIAAHPTILAAVGQPDAAPEPSTPRIVIVDDNDDVRRLLRIQIERLKSYAVIGEASDGAEAIEVAAATQPDVVFLDMAMPHMDGLEALPHILAASPDSRVVVLSGFDESSMAPKAMAAGATCYLEKGLRLNFRQIIDDVMSAA